MITEQDLREAIAECEGQRNPNANTCIKLAAFYTIREHLFGSHEEKPVIEHSFAPPTQGDVVLYEGESEFAQAIAGRDQDDMWAVMDELMDTLSVVNPRLYAGVMRRIAE